MLPPEACFIYTLSSLRLVLGSSISDWCIVFGEEVFGGVVC